MGQIENLAWDEALKLSVTWYFCMHAVATVSDYYLNRLTCLGQLVLIFAKYCVLDEVKAIKVG